MDDNIKSFLESRKEKYIAKESNPSTSADELTAITNQANILFSPQVWIPNAASRANQISLSSHPCTFSHPSSRKNKNGYTTTILTNPSPGPDGLLRSGNVHVSVDAFGNAAAMDVYKFLHVVLSDGETLLSHVENDSPEAVSLLSIPGYVYEDLKSGFLSIKAPSSEKITSSKIKQVYFPLGHEGEYHQLSILTPSGIVNALNKRITEMKFGEKATEARELRKKNEPSDSGFDELLDLTVIGFGGSKPQNISVLNNANAGRAYLLKSMPPVFKSESIRQPTTNFFSQTLNPFQFKDEFKALHKHSLDGRNNIDIRNRRDKVLTDIYADVVDLVWRLREKENGWSSDPKYAGLPKHQKVLLDNEYAEERDSADAELFVKDIARWVILSYKKILKNEALFFDDEYLAHIAKIMNEEKEDLL